ncbi:uncharacterized protein LOC133912839 isoform X2 [Phragmites australis]|uniref:uncharacterized protein LOC133912839 isoform X2 n=1 Tax=Phragmites australis TaxID=29695 RepID=UPI002D78D55B|nr:uncharacterized protein LOC133912839 isoform X2 [Phragmites australis]
MIKRRYFRQDHGDKSGSSSSSSSSSSDSDRDPAEEAVADEEVEEEQEQEAGGEELGEDKEMGELEPQVQEESSGYQSEDSSGNDVDGPSADDDEEHISPRDEEHHEISLPVKKSYGGNADSAKSAANTDDAVEADFTNCILKCKSVYKCKLCPRIMCLNDEMVMVHLKSKRHSRSKKLLGEGRLKLMLNSDGELEEEQETHAERYARTIALAQQVQKPKKDSGRQRQNRRRKKRSRNHQEKNQETQNSDKKRCKTKG